MNHSTLFLRCKCMSLILYLPVETIRGHSLVHKLPPPSKLYRAVELQRQQGSDKCSHNISAGNQMCHFVRHKLPLSWMQRLLSKRRAIAFLCLFCASVIILNRDCVIASRRHALLQGHIHRQRHTHTWSFSNPMNHIRNDTQRVQRKKKTRIKEFHPGTNKDSWFWFSI